MQKVQLPPRELGERCVLAVLFTALGSLIIIVFSPVRPLFGGAVDYLGRLGLGLLLLVTIGLVRKNRGLEKYWQILLGLLILLAAVSLDWIFANYLIAQLGINGDSPLGFSLLKLNECGVVIGVVIFLTLSSGSRLGSIYIQKGNLRLSLIIGLTTFLLAAVLSMPMASLLFNFQYPGAAKMVRWIPWLLTAVLANAAQEELLFRGLFLRRLQPYFGKFLSNMLIVLVFTLLHKGAAYSSNEYILLAVLMPLALAWGCLMQKTDNLWGSVLFHAGMDIPILLGIFSNLA